MEAIDTPEIEIGTEVWIEYTKGTYLGFEDGKHKVLIKKRDEETIKRVPLVLIEDNIEPPQHIKDKQGRPYRYSGRKTVWSGNYGLSYRYYYESTSVFKSEEILSLPDIANNYIETDGSGFWDEGSLYVALDEIEDEARPIKKQIQELETLLREINKKKAEVYKHCFHKWDKDEEEETSKGSFQQLCTCQICGKEEYNRYSKLW